jgi:hypothetical protein
MTPRLWQRQPGEAPTDFTAFIAYLRLQGRRSHRVVATRTGRSLGAVRRLSARFNWPARVAAFEARLADASQDALDLLVRSTSTRTTADFERLRSAEFLLAQRVLHEARRWLRLASDPRRRETSLGQVCRVIELATKLGRLAAGMPTGDQPRRRPRREDAPGFWTGPSAEEALEKVYGVPLRPEAAGSQAPLPADSGTTEPERVAQPGGGSGRPLDTTVASAPLASRAPVDPHSQSLPSSLEPASARQPPSTARQRPAAAPDNRRRDAWSAWGRLQRSRAASRQR